MAGCRYAFVTRKYMSNVLIPKNQPCLQKSRHQPYSVLNNPRELYKKSSNQDVYWSTHHVNLCMEKRNDYRWNEAVLLITGASTGIGSFIMRQALEEGVKGITNVDSDEKNGVGIKSELNHKYGGEKVQFVKCDLSNEEQLKGCFKAVLGDKKETYVVVNNAGSQSNLKIDQYKKQIDMNVSALVAGSLTALDMMRTDKDGQGGAIINISSVAALCPLPVTPIFNATKSAVLTFSLGLGNEDFYSRTGVRVMSICLGATDAGFHDIANMASLDRESRNKYAMAMRNYPGQSPEAAARAVIEMYKQGDSGSTWLSNANKPAEDITDVIKQAYSLLTQPIFT